MKTILAKLGMWLVNRFNSGVYVVRVNHDLVEAAKSVSTTVNEDVPGAAGENKRHRAFAKLCRMFPNESGKDVSIAIEIALRN